jgi:hypothetical protein
MICEFCGCEEMSGELLHRIKHTCQVAGCFEYANKVIAFKGGKLGFIVAICPKHYEEHLQNLFFGGNDA